MKLIYGFILFKAILMVCSENESLINNIIGACIILFFGIYLSLKSSNREESAKKKLS